MWISTKVEISGSADAFVCLMCVWAQLEGFIVPVEHGGVVMLWTHGHGGAVLAHASVQDHVEVVVAGEARSADDAHDGKHVELHPQDRQLKHTRAR